MELNLLVVNYNEKKYQILPETESPLDFIRNADNLQNKYFIGSMTEINKQIEVFNAKIGAL
jgi:hypothetical protein